MRNSNQVSLENNSILKADSVLDDASLRHFHTKQTAIATRCKRFNDVIRNSLIGSWIHSRIKLKNALSNEKGQGTTEYAILVGALVVIAILAITLFKPKLQELWTSIADGINSL